MQNIVSELYEGEIGTKPRASSDDLSMQEQQLDIDL
jgi:hypothetical protein